MYILRMNDGVTHSIVDPVETTTVVYNGVDTKAIRFILEDQDIPLKALKESFKDDFATAKLTVEFPNGDLASEFTNFTKLARIGMDENDRYFIIMAETSDLPALIKMLEKTQVKQSEALDSIKKEYEEKIKTLKEDIRVTSEKLQKAEESLTDANNEISGYKNTANTLSEKIEAQKTSLEELQTHVSEQGDRNRNAFQNIEATISNVSRMASTSSTKLDELGTHIENIREKAAIMFDENISAINDISGDLSGVKNTVEQITTEQSKLSKSVADLTTHESELIAYDTNFFNEEEASLDECKEHRISVSKLVLEDVLNENPIRSSVHGGVEKEYSVSAAKQQYLGQMIVLAESANKLKESGKEQKDFAISWNARGEEATSDWTLEELYTLSIEIENYVRPFIKKQQEIEEMINLAETKDEVAAVEIVYEDLL